MTDTSDKTLDAPRRFSMKHNRNGLGFYDGVEEDADGYLMTVAEHDRIVAEKDAEIARLVSERQRVDRRIKNQRAQLAWWNKLFHERLAAACRRRIYYPNWTPVLYRRAKARRAIKGDDNLRAAREKP